jgi:hypothetical protein
MVGKSDKPGTSIALRHHLAKTITIDGLIADYNLTEIDILKIDIEGSEKEVFRTCVSWIAKVKAIIIELHERIKSGCNRAVYSATNDFDSEWQYGEEVYFSKHNYITDERR